MPPAINPPRLGIIGAGQLARMTSTAALQLGCEVVILGQHKSSPAFNCATKSIVGNLNSYDDLLLLAREVDVVTLENEFVDATLLHRLEQAGHRVVPSPQTIGLVQDKFVQKQYLAGIGVPVPRLSAVGNIGDLPLVAQELGLPLVLKARRNGYDGKGNATVKGPADFEPAWRRLGGFDGNPLFAEAWCPFVAELALVVTRGQNGDTAVYPVTETVQKNHVCHIVRAPASFAPEIVQRATQIAVHIVQTLGVIGSFAVEMFLTQDGQILVNELAPRVHNSGHYSIEGSVCSQFENHVRAVFGWPLGSTRLVAPAAVMVNLLGYSSGSGVPIGLDRALRVPTAHVHLYGKSKVEPGRKMGHVTVLADSLAQAELSAVQVAGDIQFGLT